VRARLLEQYLAAIAGTDPDGSLLEVRYRRRNGGMRQRFYPAASDLASTASLIIELGARTDVYVGAAPRSCRHGGRAAIEKVWCLWVDCDGPEAVTALGRFAPAPAIVVSSGSAANVHAYWPLRTPIDPQEAEVANRRLAQAVTADPASTEPARILRPPGTRNHKHNPSTAVELVRLTRRRFGVEQLVSRLDDPAWPVAVTAAARGPRRTGQADRLLAIEPERYVLALCGQRPNRDHKVSCPLHEDKTPSLHVYPTAQRGWRCYSCQRGGSLYDLAAAVWATGTRRGEFHQTRRRLWALLYPHTPYEPYVA